MDGLMHVCQGSFADLFENLLAGGLMCMTAPAGTSQTMATTTLEDLLQPQLLPLVCSCLILAVCLKYLHLCTSEKLIRVHDINLTNFFVVQ